jgi:hypothetical protein
LSKNDSACCAFLDRNLGFDSSVQVCRVPEESYWEDGGYFVKRYNPSVCKSHMYLKKVYVREELF